MYWVLGYSYSIFARIDTFCLKRDRGEERCFPTAFSHGFDSSSFLVFVPPSLVSSQTFCHKASGPAPPCYEERKQSLRTTLVVSKAGFFKRSYFQILLRAHFVLALGFSKRSVRRVRNLPAFLSMAHFRSRAETCRQSTSREEVVERLHNKIIQKNCGQHSI